MFRSTRLAAASVLVWAGSVGLSDREFQELMARHVQARFGMSDTFVCRTAVRALQQHHANGDRVLVVTGSTAELAAYVCDGIGVPSSGVEIVGSSLRRAWGGWVAGEHCFGPHKVRMLARLGIVRADCVYTDSSADIPLLGLGTRRVLVNATAKHREAVASRLSGSFEAVTWT